MYFYRERERERERELITIEQKNERELITIEKKKREGLQSGRSYVDILYVYVVGHACMGLL